MNANLKKYLGVISAAGLLVTASSTASAATFTVTSQVQNTLTVATTANMDLGTLFATAASSTQYNYIILSPDSSMGTAEVSGGLTLLSLGTPIAAQGTVTVGVGNTTPFDVTLPAYEITMVNDGVDAGNITTLNGFDDNNKVAHDSGNTTIARFALVNFRAGNVPSLEGTAAGTCATSNVCTITPLFAGADVNFYVGATIVTDTGGNTAYQAGTYNGSFEVTASY